MGDEFLNDCLVTYIESDIHLIVLKMKKSYNAFKI